MSAQPAPEADRWAAAGPVEVALRAQDEVRGRLPWWWRPLRRTLLMQAVEVYVQAVLRAYAKGAVEGWPPGIVDHALLPRRRRTTRRPRAATARPADAP